VSRNKKEAERWTYVIEGDGTLCFGRMTEGFVLHAGRFTREYWQIRAANGVWVLFSPGALCVMELDL
jgi:hypothetical protein